MSKNYCVKCSRKFIRGEECAYDNKGNLAHVICLVGTAEFLNPRPADELSGIQSTAPESFMKNDQGKPAYHLLMPEFLDGIATVLEFGARKYEPNNWARGAEWSRYFAALQRHMWAWWGGEDNDPETGLSHLYHAGCCLMFLGSYMERGLGDDDRFISELDKRRDVNQRRK